LEDHTLALEPTYWKVEDKKPSPMSRSKIVPHDEGDEKDMDEDVDGVGVVRSIISELPASVRKSVDQNVCNTCFLVSNRCEMAMSEIGRVGVVGVYIREV
jgi:hypothetical protein